MKLFVYGSLLNPDSAERALQRRPAPGQLRPASLDGYRLAWTSIHRVDTDAAGEIDASFLNLIADPAATVPGALLDIDDAEFARLCLREKGYTACRLACRTDGGAPVDARVFIDERPTPAQLPPVLAGYLGKIEAGLAQLPGHFAATWRAALPPPRLPLIAGAYRFVDSAQKANT